MRDLLLKLLIKAKDEASGPVRKLWRGIRRGARDSRAQIAALTKQFFSLKTAIVAGLTALGLTRSVDVTARYESLRLQLEGIEGSALAADKVLADLQNAFRPALLDQATQAYIALRNRGMQPTMEEIQGLIDFNGKLGQGQENLNGIIAQLGQGWSKQKLQYEDLLVLMERGVPVFDLLSAATGRQVADLVEMASKGQLGRDAIRALIAEMGKVGAGSSARALTSWDGMKRSLGALAELIQRQFMQGGLFKSLKAQLGDFVTVLEYIANSGIASEWGKQVGNAAKDAGTYLESLARFARYMALSVKGFISSVAAGLDIIGATAATAAHAVAQARLGWAVMTNDKDGARKFETQMRGMRAVVDEFMDRFKQNSDDMRQTWDDLTHNWDKGPDSTSWTAAWKGLVDDAKQYNQEVEQAKQKTEDAGGKEIKKRILLDGTVEYYNDLAEVERKSAEVDGTEIHKRVQLDGITEYHDGMSGTEDLLKRTGKAAKDAGGALNDLGDKTDGATKKQEKQKSIIEMTTDEYVAHRKAARASAKAEADQAKAAGDAAGAVEHTGEAMTGAASVAAMMAQAMRTVQEEMRALSPAAEAAFDSIMSRFDGSRTFDFSIGLQATTDAAEQVRQEIQGVEQEIDTLRTRYTSATDFGRYFVGIELAAANVRREYLLQTQAAEGMIASLRSLDEATAGAVKSAEDAIAGFSLLDAQRLSAVTAEVNRLKQANQELADSVESTLSNLQNEYDREMGNEAAIQMREYARDRAKLEEQYRQAQRTGAVETQRQAKDALKILDALHRKKMADLGAELELETKIGNTRSRHRTSPLNVISVKQDVDEISRYLTRALSSAAVIRPRIDRAALRQADRELNTWTGGQQRWRLLTALRDTAAAVGHR